MKARKTIGWLLFILVLAMVGAFLALHTLNLFMFVFPGNQSQWAWLGFGLTGIGALGYTASFLWLAKTNLQKVVSLLMAVVCFVAEAVAAFFGMQIETWRKVGWSMTEQEVQTMLTVIGILAILHFFALLAHFAGDKVLELFGDHDGDGIPNHSDPDYEEYKKSRDASPSKSPAPRSPSPDQNGRRPALRNYSLPELLTALNTDSVELAELLQDMSGNAQALYSELNRQGVIPSDLGMINFVRLARTLPNPTRGA